MRPQVLRNICLSLAAVCLIMQTDRVWAVNVSADETIVFFPTAGWMDEDKAEWQIPIHGWIFELEENALRKAAVKSIMESFDIDKDSADAKRLGDRMAFFLADNERNKDIKIKVGSRIVELEESERDGHFFGRFSLSAAEAKRLAPSGRLAFQVVMPFGDRRKFSGVVQLVPPTGVSVISDIDDTIKITEVPDKRRAIANTFLKPFREAPGMAALYRGWSAKGMTFHYVSSSPYQLASPLTRFMAASRFPVASMHLKRARLKDSSVLLFAAESTVTKPPQIEALLRRYPQRDFVLVGDSGEKDPEVYGDIARRFGTQIRKVLIRNVTAEDEDSRRFERAFRNVPRKKWTLFDRTDEL